MEDAALVQAKTDICHGNEIKLHLMVRLLEFGEYGVPLNYHHCQVRSDLEW